MHYFIKTLIDKVFIRFSFFCCYCFETVPVLTATEPFKTEVTSRYDRKLFGYFTRSVFNQSIHLGYTSTTCECIPLHSFIGKENNGISFGVHRWIVILMQTTFFKNEQMSSRIWNGCDFTNIIWIKIIDLISMKLDD